jgi:ribosomal protein S18 acetylase RimI-like enzyme
MDMKIRVARAGDLKPLAALARKTYVEAFGHSFEPADLTAHMKSKLSDACFKRYLGEDTFFLAEQHTSLIGFLQIGAARPDPLLVVPGDAELRRVYVLSDHQNRGVGRRLIDKALTDTIAREARSIFLDVWELNVGARRLYERYGFTVVGKRPFKLESGVETGFDLIMVRHNRSATDISATRPPA